ncbi:glycosyl hydrolase family 18 protein [Paenibacillus sp. KQZ6P-2]|uniref:Glycosyl hydrolase family 18 protein n=1 Tax=Paenibacillus mangrovi TaxID=2931978 RepID=A0A9X1WVT3_9BACL|nr:glycosyl hydrolase family 18 protein [Paenibacillus mangrovi]MCJ8014473.1 glycosyl hydrolase family 18 protein [Paenibacillus mangrovi]
MTRSRRRRHSSTAKGRFAIVLGLCLIAVGAYLTITQLLPNPLHVKPDWNGLDKPIFVKGKLLDESAEGTGEQLKLPLPVLQETVDPNIRYEKETQSLILTTPTQVMHLQTGEKEAQLNNKQVQLRFAPEEKNNMLYLPVQPLKEMYGITVHEDPDTGAVLLMNAGDTIQMGKVNGAADATIPLRKGPSKHEPILADMPGGTPLRIWNSDESWYFVQMDNGYAGYVPKSKVTLGEKKTVDVVPEKPTHTERNWKGKKVNLAWDAVYQKKPDPSVIDQLSGVNVVSPTWFSIIDGEGNVRSKADTAYVTKAHARGMEVWGLLDNSFNPDITSSAMATYETRLNTINQMLHFAKMYHLDGINIDFENVKTKDGENISQFVRELKPLARSMGLIVSVDVTPKSDSEMWSRFLDRRSLGEAADYIILMAYDEHWASSPEAGSVASLPWTEAAVRKILDEDGVPPEKLVLAVPLYTRIWSEEVKDGKTKVSSKAVGMKTVNDIIAEKKLKPKYLEDVKQNYVEYTEDGVLKKIWIEDATSLKERVNLAKELNLGGVAAWTRSFGTEEAWNVLKDISS